MDRIDSYAAKTEVIAQQDVLAEYMMNALRLVNGVSLTEASQFTGLDIDQITTACQIGRQRELINLNGDRLQPTEQGQRLLNLCLQSFL